MITIFVLDCLFSFQDSKVSITPYMCYKKATLDLIREKIIGLNGSSFFIAVLYGARLLRIYVQKHYVVQGVSYKDEMLERQEGVLSSFIHNVTKKLWLPRKIVIIKSLYYYLLCNLTFLWLIYFTFR